MSSPDPQPPTTTETDVSALREQIIVALADHQWQHTRDTHCACGFRTPLAQLAVEGYVAHVADQILPALLADLSSTRERLREVENERDAAREANGWNEWACKQNQNLYAETLARAESAEAAHEALRAERDEAWKVAAQRRNEARRYYVAWQVARMRARSLRALLGGGTR